MGDLDSFIIIQINSREEEEEEERRRMKKGEARKRGGGEEEKEKENKTMALSTWGQLPLLRKLLTLNAQPRVLVYKHEQLL